MTANETIIREYLAMLAQMQAKTLPAGVVVTPAQFMLEHGRFFRVGPGTYAGRRDPPQQCYANAGRRAVASTTLTYVEGYVTCVGLPIPHAFLATRGGLVVDPTLLGRETRATEDRAYFGLPFKASHLRRATNRAGYWGLLDSPKPDATLGPIIRGEGVGLLALT